MGIVTQQIPSDIALELARLGGASVFVETGTNHGATTRWAAQHFDAVFTIEKAEELYNLHKDELNRIKGVKALLGDSRNVLPSVLSELGDRKALFWLDGHWCGGLTAGADDECPLMDELACMAGRAGDIILIDDARLFLCAPPPPCRPSAWPTIADITETLLKSHGRPFIQVIDDAIIAVPNEAPLKKYLTQVAQERSEIFWRKFASLQRGTSWTRGLKSLVSHIVRRIVSS